ncbi:PREDICTED: serine/threonine-protein kinase Nek10-like [Priapulus caudatus]|uniref:Serine/threonine-protein kinase Nek10-like n=1 Tax=Priapulus caudatus TaxID=37621 RepID=A0ABM1DYJ0_PRICU|nr:PREDICTED: serine/threonine-protein kinase Nek10-like [Priapulus caudatus]
MLERRKQPEHRRPTATRIYAVLAWLLLPEIAAVREENTGERWQKNAFRALRFMFSMEGGNRGSSRPVVPGPELFEGRPFIDVGHYVRELSAGGVGEGFLALKQVLEKVTAGCHGDSVCLGDPCGAELVKEAASVCQKLTAVQGQRRALVDAKVHRHLVLLLATRDVSVLHSVLRALISIAEDAACATALASINVTESLLKILQAYDLFSKRLASQLLRLISCQPVGREDVKLYRGLPTLLSLLHSGSVELVWNTVWTLVNLVQDADLSNDIRLQGGIPIFLSLLQDGFPGDEDVLPCLTESPGSSSAVAAAMSSVTTKQEERKRAYVLSLRAGCCAVLTELMLDDGNSQSIVDHGNAIYAVAWLLLPETPRTTQEKHWENLQINVDNPVFGKQEQGRDDTLANEMGVIQEKLKHPNVVKYHKVFSDRNQLFILMELIEGAPLAEHFSSLKEKAQRFSEERIWNIFTQMVLALRYLHKEKGIVHRDLTPNNIMLGANDKVTITDFGLAKHAHKEMTSIVGTITYASPEIVQNLPYNEKVDVWAAGAVLYEMCRLTPAFYSTNMLSLAIKLPPSLKRSPRRHLVECFKQKLFAQKLGSTNIKTELSKIISGSEELVDFGTLEPHYVINKPSVLSNEEPCPGVTYRHLQSVVESVLVENGYYDVQQIQKSSSMVQMHQRAALPSRAKVDEPPSEGKVSIKGHKMALSGKAVSSAGVKPCALRLLQPRPLWPVGSETEERLANSVQHH